MVKTLGKYKVKSVLGKGAMGVVYLGEDPRLGRLVALKTMSSSVLDDAELLQRFYREAQSAGKLHHPNIVTIYDIDEADGIPFIAMEFLEGQSLEKIIAARKELPLLKKLDIIIQVCKGLHYAHQNGIVHRDVKGGNVVVRKDGTVKIVDFGIARLMASAAMTRAGMVMGTPMYMAPEHVMGLPVDHRADLFSIGVILYEFLTYENPFAAPDTAAILYKIVQTTPPPLRNKLSNCPPGLEEVVQRALEKDKEKRYQSAEDIAFDLEQIADSIRRDTFEIYVEEGRQFLEEGKFELAKESLKRVLEIDSHHNIARNLLAKVKEQMLLVRKQKRIGEMLSQARDFLDFEDYDQALKLIDDALGLDPDHPSAKDLKLKASSAQAHKMKVAQQMESAGKLAETGDLAGTKIQLEEILATDPQHTSANALMSWVSREMEAQERQRNVRKFLSAARAHSEAKDYAQASDLLTKARELDPLNVEVESLTQFVLSEQEKEERRRVLEERLALIQQALDREQFEEGLTLTDHALQEFPNDQRLRGLHAQAARLAEIQRKRRYVDEQLQGARSLFVKDQYPEAIRVLQAALEVAPEDVGMLSFLKTVEEAQERTRLDSLRQNAVREANDLIRGKNFPLAIESLERAIARLGDSPELQGLLRVAREEQAERERQERVREALNRANSLLHEAKYEEAIRFLQEAQAQEVDAEITALLVTARQQWEEYLQRRDETVKRARKMLEEGQAAKGLALLQAAPKSYGQHGAFREVYDQCREAVQRAGLLQAAVERVAGSLESGKLAEAQALLDQAAQTYGEDPGLVEVGKRLREEQAKAQQAEWRKVLDEAGRAIEAKEYENSRKLLESLPPEIGRYPSLASQRQALLARIVDEEARREKIRAQQAREEAIKAVCVEAQALVEKQDFDRSLNVLQTGLVTHPGEARLLNLQRDAAAAKASYERERALQEVVRQITELTGQNQLHDARQLIQDAVQKFDGDTRLLDLQKQLAKQEAQAKNRALKEMQKLEREMKGTNEPARLDALVQQANLEADKWPNDQRIRSLALGIAKLRADKTAPQKPASLPEGTVSHGLPQPPPRGPGQADTTLVGRPVVRPAAHAPREAVPGTTVPQVRPSRPRTQRMLLLIGGLLAVGILAALPFLLRNKSPSPGPAAPKAAVEILTVPEGAKVKVDDQECATPGCQLNLAPGTHRVEAQLPGYQTVVKSFDVDVTQPQATTQVRLTLEPAPVPKASSPEGAPAAVAASTLGTLVVDTGEAGAEVLVNGKRYGLTAKDGSLHIPLEENEYSVRVEKGGFEAVSPRHIRIRKTRETQVRFNLKPVPQIASLVIQNALAGASVSLDGRPVGVVQSDGGFSTPVNPGNHIIELTKAQYKPVRVQRSFAAGEAVRLGTGAVEQALIPAPPISPPKPSAPAVDPQVEEWKRISGSSDPRAFEEFRRKYPTGQYAEQAAKRAEQLEWNSIQNSKDPAALTAYLSKYPTGPFSQLAQRRIQTLQSAAQAAKDREGVLDALRRYSSAVGQRNLDGILAVWPDLSKRQQNTLKESFKRFQSIRMEFHATEAPQITGRAAKVLCQRSVESIDQQGSHTNTDNVTVQLQQSASRWVITSIE